MADFLAFVVFFAVALAYYLLGTENYRVSDAWVIVIGVATYLVLTCVHEGGHALMAVLTKRQLVGVVVGHGSRRFARFRLRSVVFEVRANLLGGRTIAAPQPGQSGDALFILGGVGAESIVLAAACFWDPASPSGNVVRLAIIMLAAHDVFANLWPRNFEMPPYGRIPNDGRQLLDLFRNGSRADDSEIEVTAADIESLLLAETDGFEPTLARAEADFGAAPENKLNRLRFGQYLLSAERWREAVDVLRPLEDLSGVNAQGKALLLNSLAWAAVMTFDESLVADADRWSAEAVEIWPVEPAISSTRGSTLVITDRPDEGMPLLARAYRTCGAVPRNQALVSGFGAMGAALRGDRLLMRRRYAAMLSHDPQCTIRREVERRIAEPEVLEFSALVRDAEGDIDIECLSPSERKVLPAMATLVLARIDGFVCGARLGDDEVVDLGDRSVPVRWVRAAARRLLAGHVLESSSS